MKNNNPLFNDVENLELRTWNRCAMIFNIGKDHGVPAMKSYAANFKDEDRDSITEMFKRIEHDGYEATRAAVVRGNQPYALN